MMALADQQTLFNGHRSDGRQPHFDDDHLVTKTLTDLKINNDNTEIQHSTEKRVRFNESASKIHENETTNDDKGHLDLWYSANDLALFRQEYTDLLLTLRYLDREAANNPDAWAGALRRAYHIFSVYTTYSEEMVNALRMIPNAFLLSALGTEKVAIRSIITDTVSRRKQIYMNVLEWQRAPIRDELLRTRMIRDVSRNISRPSRLYARHIAEMAAGRLMNRTSSF